MTQSPDLILLPLRRESAASTGDGSVLATVAPKRPARGRASERLILHLAVRGNAPFSEEARKQLLNSLARMYFRSPGSATKATRAAIDALNKDLLERNMRTSRQGLRAVGLMNMLVIRNDRLYLAQCGPVHTFLMRNDEVSHFFDDESGGRGLGMARVAPLRYHYASLKPGDRLLLAAHLPKSWNAELIEKMGQGSMRSVYWELVGTSDDDLDALLLDVKKGDGALKKLTPRNLPSPTTTIPEAPAQDTSVDARKPLEKPADERESAPKPSRVPGTSPAVVTAPVSESAIQEAQEKEPEPAEPRPNLFRETIAPVLVTMLRAIRTTLQQFGKFMKDLARRLLPDDSLFNISNSVMAFIAVAVPLVVITIASVVYFQRGREYLYAEYFNTAVGFAQQAAEEEDPVQQRELWSQVLTNLDQAEAYQETEDSQQLGFYAHQIMDDLDRVERVSYLPAIPGGFPRQVEIIKMLATSDELYMLDGIRGEVIRAVRQGNTFNIDADFYCGPVPAPDIVGPLVDISLLPPSDPNGAAIMGMDDDGVLVKCTEDGEGVFTIPMGVPDTNWGQPSAMTMNSMDLFILDPATSSVWVYWGRDSYRELPSYFFGNEIPTMADVIDITVRNQDLFLLHADSQVTQCTYGLFQDAPTRCIDPMTYQNLPAGMQDGPVFAGSDFDEMVYVPPPEPSLFILDGDTHSIHRFSLQLSYDRQYMSQDELSDQPATAFAISPTREVFIAIADQVYYSILP